MEPNTNKVDTTQEIDLVDLVIRCLRRWKLFLACVVTCVALAVAYIFYAIPDYKVTSTVVIKDEKKGQVGADITAFQDLGIMATNDNLENELEVLKSKTIYDLMVNKLNLHVSYFEEGWLKDIEIYKQTPVFVIAEEAVQDGTFKIYRHAEDGTLSFASEMPEIEQVILLDSVMETPWGRLTFKENQFGRQEYPVTVRLASRVGIPKTLSIGAINKTSSVVELSLVTPCPEKGMDMINTLIELYNQQAIDEKNFVAINTTKFIDERLAIISGELSTAERNVEEYKLSRGITDIESEAKLFLATSTGYDQQITTSEIQLSTLRSIKQFLSNPANDGGVVPSNVGLTDPTILELIGRYNEEVLRKVRETTGMSSSNPVLKEFNARIATLRSNLLSGIGIAENGIQTTLRELRSKESSYNTRAVQLSTQERESRELYRQKEIKESLFIYLLQKREETGLSLALATPNAKIVDAASLPNEPVAPRKMIILAAALMLGFILPLIYIFVADMFDVKLRTKDQLTQAVKAPFLGDIPEGKAGDNFPTLKLRSGTAERFRLISSNLKFLTANHPGDNVIMITSTTSGEGKSFVSRNLALSLATTGKRVLLIDLDMRRSQMEDVIDLTPEKGIAIYLSEPQTKVSEIIDTSHRLHANLDIIPTRVFPPNPAELLDSPRLARLFAELKGKYDYIILDMAPVGLVSDVFSVNQFVTATIYVTRENYTHRGALAEVQDLYAHGKLNNMAVVLNGIDQSNTYGYHKKGSYGYGYGNSRNYYHEDK